MSHASRSIPLRPEAPMAATGARLAVQSVYARQAIITRYCGPTNYRPARIVATSEAGHRMACEWDHGLDPARNHAAAAMRLAMRLGWSGRWILGATPTGYVLTHDAGDDCAVTVPAAGA